MEQNAPYVKRIGNFSGFSVWLVDGGFVRTNLDIEFTNFGQHQRFNFIPEDEFWIDAGNVPGEEKFYITHMLAENGAMAEGRSYEEALDIANGLEREDRKKSPFIRGLLKSDPQTVLSTVRKFMLKEYRNGLRVWLVRGELVRSIFHIDFTAGGHDKVYDFIPQNEVWIDDDITESEVKFVVLHELYERHLMMKGWPYNAPEKSAHGEASTIELICRLRPDLFGPGIMKEIQLNNKMVAIPCRHIPITRKAALAMQ